MATTDNENILMMFEEINQKLDKTHLQIEKIWKQPSNETIEIDNDELIDEIRQMKTFLELLNNEHSERLSEIEAIVRKEKRRFDFSPTSINTMLIVLGFMAIILGLTLCFVIKSGERIVFRQRFKIPLLPNDWTRHTGRNGYIGYYFLFSSK